MRLPAAKINRRDDARLMGSSGFDAEAEIMHDRSL
jgi:hypothetical protein